MKALNKIRFAVTSLLLFCSVFYYCGCYTSYTATIEPEMVPAEKEYEFVNLKLKNSTEINLKDKGAKYFSTYKDNFNVIAYYDQKKDTLVVKNDSIKVHPIVLKLCLLSEISKVKIERHEFSPEGTVLLAIGIAAGVALIIIGVIALIVANEGIRFNWGSGF